MARSALLDERQAAAFLNVAADTLRHWRYEGRIAYHRLGGPKAGVRYSQYDLDKFADACKVEAKRRAA